jgi:hypothetical protein
VDLASVFQETTGQATCRRGREERRGNLLDRRRNVLVLAASINDKYNSDPTPTLGLPLEELLHPLRKPRVARIIDDFESTGRELVAWARGECEVRGGGEDRLVRSRVYPVGELRSRQCSESEDKGDGIRERDEEAISTRRRGETRRPALAGNAHLCKDRRFAASGGSNKDEGPLE